MNRLLPPRQVRETSRSSDRRVAERLLRRRLHAVPHIPKLAEPPPRAGFFEHGEYLAIREHLPTDYQDVLDFGYHSGWCRGEILRLEWRDVDRARKVIRLRHELSKTREVGSSSSPGRSQR